MIDENAFEYCDNLQNVYFRGSEEQWNQITIAAYNEPLSNATVHFAEISAPSVDENAKFASTGLSLGTFIGLENAIMKKALNGGVYDEVYFLYTNAAGETVRGELVEYKTYFVAAVPVNAKQMADVYEITPYYVVDGKTYCGVTKTASVMEEAMKKVNDTNTDDKTENTRKLCIAMLNYGAEAQKNFQYNLDNLANSQLTAEQQVLPAFDSLNLVNTNNIPTTPIKIPRSGLSLGDVVYMEFLVSQKKVDASGVITYKIGEEAAVEVPVSELEILSTYYVISIPIKAKYVRTDIVISFETVSGAYEMTCSVASFAASYAGEPQENLVASLIAYGDAADVLF